MAIKSEDLKALLERAYEEGWRGCLEMKGEAAARLADEFLSSRVESPPNSFVPMGSGGENISDPYYVYSTMTVPSAEIVWREEVV